MSEEIQLHGGSAAEEFESKFERDPDSVSPLDAYKALIDGLAATSLQCGTAEVVVEKRGFAEWSDAGKKHNAFLASLDRNQREQLAAMLRQERIGGFHDVLAAFDWCTTCRDIGLTFRGKPMPVDFAEGWHRDFVGRISDWDWPKTK